MNRDRRLGAALVDRGAISYDQLAEVLASQRARGVRLGDLLLDDEAVSRRELYVALADTWGVPLVDLIEDPPDPALLDGIEPTEMLQGRWVPHHLDTDGDGSPAAVVVATAERPDEALTAAAEHHFPGLAVKIEATTDWDIDQAVLIGCQARVAEDAAEGLALRSPALSATTGWAPWQGITAALIVLGTIVGAVLAPVNTLIVWVIALNVMFFVGVAFKFAAGVSGMVQIERIKRRSDPRRGHRVSLLEPVPESQLPRYTILVPAYHEANVVAKVIEHIGALDYPATKLQVLLLMEADDLETITAAKQARPPACVRFVVVPPGDPQTKPKACNVGLALADGEFLVIYDVEDQPEPGQLREVVARFAETPDDVVCLQARLNYFNADENILTRMFTLEYSGWFDYMLAGLDAWRLPIPLGGTSNHFRTQSLRDLGGWDPYNVTEDADLGVRASAVGLTVGITDSTTWEEACSEWRAWIRQRTRWIKGYMVTALVHTRHPIQLVRKGKARGIVGLLGLVAGTPAMFLACPLVWAFELFVFLGGHLNGLQLPGWLKLAAAVNFIAGNGTMILLVALAARRRRAYSLIPFALLNPFYWLLHSVAAWRALLQLVFSPFHWEKTPHGIVHGPHSPKVGGQPRAAGVVPLVTDRPAGWPTSPRPEPMRGSAGDHPPGEPPDAPPA